MSEPVYFVVTRRAGFEEASLCYERLPTLLAGRRAKDHGLVYALRLDTLPDPEKWLAMSLGELWRTYTFLRDRDKLPTSNIAARTAA
jgi:hypothetical protein